MFEVVLRRAAVPHRDPFGARRFRPVDVKAIGDRAEEDETGIEESGC